MICLPKHCQKRPRRSDGAITHPYCGRTCANLAKGQVPTNRNTPVPTSPVKPKKPSITTSPSNTTTLGNVTNTLGTASPTNTKGGLVSTRKGVHVPANTRKSVISMNPRDSIVSTNPRDSIISTNPRDSIISASSTIKPRNRSSAYRKSYLVPTCKTPGCPSPVYVDQDGVASDYCTRTHWKYVSQLYLFSEAGTEQCTGGDTMVASLVARPQRTVQLSSAHLVILRSYARHR